MSKITRMGIDLGKSTFHLCAMDLVGQAHFLAHGQGAVRTEPLAQATRSELAVGAVVREGVEIARFVEPGRVERGGIGGKRPLTDMGREQLAPGAGAHDAEPGVGGVHVRAGDREGGR